VGTKLGTRETGTLNCPFSWVTPLQCHLRVPVGLQKNFRKSRLRHDRVTFAVFKVRDGPCPAGDGIVISGEKSPEFK